MNSIRRFSAIVTGLLVLQLTLLGAAAPCEAMAGAAPAGGHQMHEEVATSETADCDKHAGDTRVPTRSGAQSCMMMLSCVTAVPQVTGGATLTGQVVASGPAGLRELAPHTRNTVPEPPPPRA